MITALMERLARLRGIGDAYHDYRGELKFFSADTKEGILRAMGCAVDDAGELATEVADLEAQRLRKLLPFVAAARGARIALDINVTSRDFGAMLVWSVLCEDGSRHDGCTSSADCAELWRGEVAGTWVTRRRFELPVNLPHGYHELEARIGGAVADRCLLVLSPPRCYEPQAIQEGRRLWGVAAQLYTLRSRSNWGIGDFQDLEQLLKWLAAHGAGFVGLNPLHALAPADPTRSSPYSASSRHFLNVLYIAVPAVPGFAECAAAQARLKDPAVLYRLQQMRAQELVDYAGVAELKLEILALLYQDFRGQLVTQPAAAPTSTAQAATTHAATTQAAGTQATTKHVATTQAMTKVVTTQTDPLQRFRDFVTAGGEALERHARFDALDRYFRATTGCASGWMNWPQEYRDVDGPAAARFAAEHRAEVEFYAYLQWLAHEQLARAQSLARELGMPIGLYGDYAVGANPSGSETWADRGGYCLAAEIGAPPDPLALKGQGWGIPPQDPALMLRQGLQDFVRLIRDNMRCYGALRLDHVMSLFRLWWVPAGLPPTEGAYVHYPLQQLLTVLALESARNSCLVVGEDLGVVPDEMRVAMPEFGLYHYKVMLFEKVDGRYRRPGEYIKHALATVTTHDMPTLRSYWEGLDIDLRRELNLYPSVDVENGVRAERRHDRELLLAALREQGLAPAQPSTPNEPFTPELADAVHLYLARSSTLLAVLQIEDLLGMSDPVNVPGTDHEYPNWQRKLNADLEDIASRSDIAAQLAQIDRARR
jgi:4-alpha-glucanotransferase